MSKKKVHSDEIEKEQEQYNVSDVDASNATDIEMTDEQAHEIDRQLDSQGHGKSTGFDVPHAKKFQQSPYSPSGLNDPFSMPIKDPSRVYKQISFDNFRKNGYRDIRGWIPLTAKNCTKEPFPKPDQEYGANIQLDGFWHIGDRIWAFMPRAEYAKMKEQLKRRTLARTSKLTDEFKKEGEKIKRKNLYIEDEAYGNI